MPYAKNGDINIYYEVEGEGTPLVLAHGATDHMGMFRRVNYVDALKDDFKLILVDVRGHGKSDKPHESSAYGLAMAVKMAGDIITVLDELNVDKANYFGISMGGMVGFRAAVNYLERFTSFIFGAMSPYAYPEEMVNTNRSFAKLAKAYLESPETALSLREEALGRPLTTDERGFLVNWFERIDAESVIHILTSMIDITPLTDQDLENISLPVLVFCGEDDSFYPGAKESVNHLPNSEFISLPEHNHQTSFSDIDTILPHIKEFLARVENKGV